MIPNVIHFIFGLDEQFGDIDFSFVHFLAVLTACEVNRPDTIYFHFAQEPSGIWWQKAKPYLTLNKVSAPPEIFNNPIKHVAHKADVIRLEQLMQHGGIYLDIDVVCVNPFKPLLHEQCVLGSQAGQGLCNAVILARKDAEFLQLWYDSYDTFNGDLWDYHSVKLPLKLAEQHPSLIKIESLYSFFYPTYNDPEHVLWAPQRRLDVQTWMQIGTRIRKKLKGPLLGRPTKMYYPPVKHLLKGSQWHFEKLKRSYCVHLWQTIWWERYLADLSPETIKHGDNNFSKLLRYALRHTDLDQVLDPARRDDVPVSQS